MIFNDIPEQQFPFLLKRVVDLRANLRDGTFAGPAGELHWTSNPDAVIAPSTFREAYVTPPAAQQAGYDAWLTRSLAEYRESRKNYVPSAEEQYEMRAAFGPGETVVDVFTGQKFRT